MGQIKRWAQREKRRLKALFGRDFFAVPQVRCRTERHGSELCGWEICPEGINSGSIIYSFGIGEDASFEVSLMSRYGAYVQAFDPTPKSIQWVAAQQFSPEFIMHPFGLADFDGHAEFVLPKERNHVSGSIVPDARAGGETIRIEVRKLKTFMEMLGHQYVDILKIDIEGAEYGVIDSIVADRLEIGQILVEFHHRFNVIGVEKTYDVLNKLKMVGYKIFAVSDNYEEISLIRRLD